MSCVTSARAKSLAYIVEMTQDGSNVHSASNVRHPIVLFQSAHCREDDCGHDPKTCEILLMIKAAEDWLKKHRRRR